MVFLEMEEFPYCELLDPILYLSSFLKICFVIVLIMRGLKEMKTTSLDSSYMLVSLFYIFLDVCSSHVWYICLYDLIGRCDFN